MNDNTLKRVDNTISAALNSKSPPFKALFNTISAHNGKKLRARLFLDFSKTKTPIAIKTAAAIELLHIATLVHDDILDGSTLRRNMTPLYRKWSIPISVLYGDFLFSNCFGLISKLDDIRLCLEISNAAKNILKGETGEHYQRGNLSLSAKEYLSIISDKTGTLFGVSAKLGCIIRGLNRHNIGKAYKAGINMGIAYQIYDDCADYTKGAIGKSRFSDIKQKIVTLPLIYLLKRCTRDEKQVIKHIFAKDKIMRSDIGIIQGYINHYNTIEYSIAQAARFAKQAENLSGKIAKNTGSAIGTEVMDWLSERLNNGK
jgi:octaprenyl-diphosphate synthase